MRYERPSLWKEPPENAVGILADLMEAVPRLVRLSGDRIRFRVPDLDVIVMYNKFAQYELSHEGSVRVLLPLDAPYVFLRTKAWCTNELPRRRQEAMEKLKPFLQEHPTTNKVLSKTTVAELLGGRRTSISLAELSMNLLPVGWGSPEYRIAWTRKTLIGLKCWGICNAPSILPPNIRGIK